MGVNGRISKLLAVALALAPVMPAVAQFSDGYNFIKAVRDGDGAKTMEYLNKPGNPAINARDPSTGEGVLHIVAKRHDQTWLNFMLSKGADPNARDRDGNTPLMAATQLGDGDAVRVLLENAAKPNIANSRGETPLIAAVQQRNYPIMRLLMSAGANPELADTIAGKSARDYASEDRRGGAATLRIMDEAKATPKKAVAGPVR
ncbi:ankyrin repeat domain-containing protein [uncultured Sphingomonas sp.]|mgnify:CR=1 FL=1|uniref:ankyrin repeat domain-containing protein n=1 Tax=uncultured Sphingomonas sp. TaxID=158754 RepID=UPI0025D7308C|nr:ankyrin repeat domain-containing protein [uncultured Sphingomonas sp.]